ncbi:Ubiquitin ligase-binding protein BUL1 [Spathaspora sp. JA1]|nr:Ubiquitin ligase-binding protein BUL1 [Spathaspora sp. JA1]
MVNPSLNAESSDESKQRVAGQVKPSFDETISSILPSYSMFTSTIRMNATVPENEDSNDNNPPPDYTDTNSINSDDRRTSLSSSLPAGQLSLGASDSANTRTTAGEDEDFITGSNSDFIVADENTGSWRETILDNIHRLPNLTFESHKISEAVKLEIQFTKDICEIGVKPEHVDPSLFEYKQGDFLNGYIKIQNTSDKAIPFEMFYLLFEGNFMIANKIDRSDKHPVKIRKFLEMFDFSGSWNEAHINRLVTDVGNPYRCCDIFDPIDGSYLSFDVKRTIYPKRVYKRFFTFRIPDNLLDSECNEHGLSKHVEIPPTMGMSRWELGHFPEREHNRIKDFSLLDTSISYGVMARFIGRKSTWEDDFGKINTSAYTIDKRLINSKGDEYIILKELTNYVRVIERTRIPTDNERLMKLLENKLMYNNLVSRIKEKIEAGKKMVKSIENNEFDTTVDIGRQLTETEIELAKCKQSYKRDAYRDIKAKNVVENYEVFLPLLKRSLTGSKNIGTLKLSSIKQEYCVFYIPPARFREHSIDEIIPSWKFDIPLDLTFSFPVGSSSSVTLPSIKSIIPELVVSTVRSSRMPIPIEFNHDLIYNKQVDNNRGYKDEDTFQKNIIIPFQKLSSELYSLCKTLGAENFKLEKQLVDDVKSICELEEKKMNLCIPDTKYNDNTKFNSKMIKWDVKESTATASINVGVNLESLVIKGFQGSHTLMKSYDRFNLVPDFQSCFMTRSYHIRITLLLSNNDHLRIKVPVRIQKITT